MTILRMEGVSTDIQGQSLFEGVDLTIETGERLGIIGVNGCGKSTFLKVVGGLREPDAGKIMLSQGCRIGYLAQLPPSEEGLTVQQAVYQSQRESLDLWEEYQRVCNSISDDASEAEMNRLGQLTTKLEQSGFYDLQVRADTAIQQLGLSDITAPMEKLSGGQRRRVALAQALTSQPDLLLLDEPTNHLDTDSIEWLESYLKSYAGALILITHDRYFLDRVCTRTLEIEKGKVTCFVANYSQYLEKKAELALQEESTATKRANLWRRELEWLRRGPKARATKQKARIERAEELRPEARALNEKLEINLATRRLGKMVVEITGLTKSFGDLHILRGFDFNVESGARVGLIGPNGSGKTTLLDLISGRQQADGGEILRGSTVKIGYFDQESHEMDPSQKVIEALRDVAESIPLADGRVLTASQMLEKFMFTGRLQHTLVGKLSGGERRRLYLLQILIGNPNVLLLDEPTNDLDIPTLSCLEDYLDSFPGCLLVSSHDRYFLDRTVESLLAFEGGAVPRQVLGGYTDYLASRPSTSASSNRTQNLASQQKEISAAQSTPATAPVSAKARKLSFKERRELDELEKTIPQTEAKKAELETRMAASGSDYSTVQQTFRELEALKLELDRRLTRWTELAELVE